MKAWKRAVTTLLLPSLLLVGGGGCSISDSSGGPDAGGNDLTFVDRDPPQTALNGVAFDPEAVFIYQQMMCPDPCPFGSPGIATFSPPFTLSVVENASVKVYDPTTDKDVVTVSATRFDGIWSGAAAQRDNAPYFINVQGGALPPPPDPSIPALPPGTFLDTFNLRPVPTGGTSSCNGLPSPVISDSGVLQAVARYLGVTVGDLLDPSQYGGVAVFWLYQPDFFVAIGPAAGTTVQASAGTVYNLGWSEPGSGDATQADRGFMVDTADPASPIGVSVVLFPVDQAGTEASVAPADTVNDPDWGRPWFAEPVSFTVTPGRVFYDGFQMSGGFAFPIDPNFCIGSQQP